MRTLATKMGRSPTAFALRLCFPLCLLFAVGCHSTESFEGLGLDADTPFSESGDQAPAPQWWRAFHDADLNRLIDRAIGTNFDLAVAWERLKEARAVAARSRSDLFPDLDAAVDGLLSRTDGAKGRDEDRLQLGLEADYEVDLWGRIRSQAAAEARRAEAVEADYETAVLTVSSEVALTWFRLVEARARIALLDSQVATNEKAVRSLRNRFESGQARSADVLRQARLLEATRDQRFAARSRQALQRHRLAVLLGEPPQAPALPEANARSLPERPPLPATGLPTTLIRQRPDLRAARLRIEAADEAVAAAAANRFPRLSLGAGLDTAATNHSQLFEDWSRNLASNLLAPLFDAGELTAELDRRTAILRQRINNYAQAALTAFREVEDALARERFQAERVESLEAQVRLARRASERIRNEFANGVGDFLDLLTARSETQQLERERLAARRQLIEFRVALYRALAGAVPDRAPNRPETGDPAPSANSDSTK